MTTKDFLQQAFFLDKDINLKLQELEALKSDLEKKTISYASDGSQHTQSENSTERKLCKSIDLENEINNEIDNLVNKKRIIRKSILSVSDRKLREVLTRRYLLFQTFERISVEMHLELRWIYRLHKKALSKIKTIDH